MSDSGAARETVGGDAAEQSRAVGQETTLQNAINNEITNRGLAIAALRAQAAGFSVVFGGVA